MLVNAGVAIVRDQLDQLMPQFKDSQSGFCNAYFNARVVGNPKGRRASQADGATASPDIKKAA